MTAAASRFVVIVSSGKLVPALRPPVPLELLRFGLAATLHVIGQRGPVRVRDAGAATPDGNVLADFGGEVSDPAILAGFLDAVPGIVGHGLFAPTLVSEVLIGGEPGGVRRMPELR